MKEKIIYVITFFTVIFSAGCSRPKTIPDNELEEIFKRMYVVNSYAQGVIGYKDSVDVYTPILTDMGYTQKDFIYTLGNFSKRKSARMSDIIEVSIEMLETEADYYERRVARLDAVDSIARSRLAEVMVEDSVIRVSRLNDTARLRFTMPVKEGKYSIAYNYMIDTADHNDYVAGSYSLFRKNGIRLSTNRLNMNKGEKTPQNITFESDDLGRLDFLFADYNKAEERPEITIDSLTITYYPPLKYARASLDSTIVYIANYIGNDSTQNSGTLPLQPPYAAQVADSLADR